MKNGASLGKNTLDLFTKWSEAHLELLHRRQQLFKEASDSFLGVVRASSEMKVPEESLKKLSGNMLALFRLPLNTFGDQAGLNAYSVEFKKLLAGMPLTLTGNGFSEEFRQYGKTSWANGSKAHSACMNWMMSLLHGQTLTSNPKEAEEAVKNCLEATESFLKQSVACWMDQLEAGSGLVKHGLLKELSPAQPVQ